MQGEAGSTAEPLGHMPLLEWTVWVLGLRPAWSIQTLKTEVLVYFKGVLYKGHTRGRPWEMGRTALTTGKLGSHNSKLYLLVTL